MTSDLHSDTLCKARMCDLSHPVAVFPQFSQIKLSPTNWSKEFKLCRSSQKEIAISIFWFCELVLKTFEFSHDIIRKSNSSEITIIQSTFCMQLSCTRTSLSHNAVSVSLTVIVTIVSPLLSPTAKYNTNSAAHYNGVIMSAKTSQITSVSILCSTVGPGADHRKHESSTSLAFVRGIHRWLVNSPHKRPVTRKMLQFDDFITKEAFFQSNELIWSLWHTTGSQAYHGHMIFSRLVKAKNLQDGLHLLSLLISLLWTHWWGSKLLKYNIL